MISPGRVDTVDGDGCVKGQYQTEKAKQQTEPYTGTAFQEPADPQGDKERRDKHDHCDRVSLCFGNRAKHQAASIAESKSQKQVLWRKVA